MVERRLTSRRNVLERPTIAGKVLEALISGAKDTEVAARFKVSRSAIHYFKERHKVELNTAVATIESRLAEAAIADKVRRILDADADYNLLGDVIRARSQDTRHPPESGYSTGLMAHDVKVIGRGQDQQTIDIYKPDVALLLARATLRRNVAEELGQLPRPDMDHTSERVVIIRERIIERVVSGDAHIDSLG